MTPIRHFHSVLEPHLETWTRAGWVFVSWDEKPSVAVRIALIVWHGDKPVIPVDA